METLSLTAAETLLLTSAETLSTLITTASRESADFLSSSQPGGGTSTSGCLGSPSDRFPIYYGGLDPS